MYTTQYNFTSGKMTLAIFREFYKILFLYNYLSIYVYLYYRGRTGLLANSISLRLRIHPAKFKTFNMSKSYFRVNFRVLNTHPRRELFSDVNGITRESPRDLRQSGVSQRRKYPHGKRRFRGYVVVPCRVTCLVNMIDKRAAYRVDGIPSSRRTEIRVHPNQKDAYLVTGNRTRRNDVNRRYIDALESLYGT